MTTDHKNPWYRAMLGIPAKAPLPKMRRKGYTGIILTKKGDLEHHDITHAPAIRREAGGLYLKEAHARFWNPRPIPMGWVTMWPEDDPEPISHREPIGYFAKTLDLLTGSHNVHIITGGLKGAKGAMRPWMAWLVAGGVAVAGIIAFVIWYKAKYGA